MHWCLVIAITAIGVKTNLKSLLDVGWRPFVLIVAETLALRLTAFDIAPDGSLSNRRVWADLSAHMAAPDGICLDAEGAVWIANALAPRLMRIGEGGVLVTDDPELAARAIIMSGAYEHNWKKHPGLANSFVHWQNKLPLYNMRMQNLSAAVIRPQLPVVARRVTDGRRNHDWVAAQLNATDWLVVPDALPPAPRIIARESDL